MELSEKKVIGPDLIQETKEKVKMIRERLKVATDRQKSYADMKRKYIRYEVGDKVFLKVSPWKKVMRFGKNGKLSPRFIGPYEVIEKVGIVAYHLALPLALEKIHNVFHVSMLWRYRSNPSHVVSSKTIELRLDLTYEEEPEEILAREVKIKLSIRGKIAGLLLQDMNYMVSTLMAIKREIDDARCHAPIPGPTRMTDPNRVRDVRPNTGTLNLIFFFFFLKANWHLWVWPTPYNRIKITTTGEVSIKIYTHILSPIYKYKTVLLQLQIRA